MRDMLILFVVVLAAVFFAVVPENGSGIDKADAVPKPISILQAIGRGDGVCPLSRGNSEASPAEQEIFPQAARALVQGESDAVVIRNVSADSPSDRQGGAWMTTLLLGLAFALFLAWIGGLSGGKVK